MRKTIMFGMVSFAAVALLCGCDDFGENRGKGQGQIVPLIGLDSQMFGSGAKIAPESRADGETAGAIGVNDLSVTLEKTEGDYKKTWESVESFAKECETAKFSIGEYRLSVWYGDVESIGFDVPAYYGSSTLTVKDDQATEVGVSASMSKAMFSFAYTEAFTKYMSEWSIEVGGVDVSMDETRPAYVLPGETAVKMTFTTVAGQTATTTVATVNAAAKHHYKVTVDVNGGEVGDPSLKVDWDETLDTETVEIKLEGLFNSEPPAITSDGFVAGEPVNFVEGFVPETPLKFNIVAMGGLKSVLLETSSLGLRDWPASVELLGADAATQQQLTGKGLAVRGLWRNPAQMAQIDFAGVLKNIKTNADDNTTVFSVTVTDNYGRTETQSLTVVAEGLILNLDPENEAFYTPGEPLVFTMEYNGPDPKANIEFTYIASNASRPRPVTDWTVEPYSRAASRYKVTVSGFTTTDNISLTAKCNGQSSSTVIKAPRYVVSADENNVFATYAYVSVFDNETNSAADLSNLTFGATVNGSAIAVGGAVEGNYYKITGLTPGQVNNVRVISDERSTVASFTTETKLQLPNSDMENWYRQNGESSYWWIDYPGADENAVWGTMNKLTTSAGGSGTNMFNHRGASFCAFSGTRPTGSGFSDRGINHGTANQEKVHAGNYSAVISTVGWGDNDGNGGTSSGKGCKNLTVGELYLGSYNASNQQPEYTGYSFASRPSALKFYYYYCAQNSADYGYVEVWVKDKAGNIIASGNKNLVPCAEYVDESIDLSYSVNSGKASSICVIFKSSNNPDCQTINTTNLSCPIFGNTTSGRFTGSELFVDDMELIY